MENTDSFRIVDVFTSGPFSGNQLAVVFSPMKDGEVGAGRSPVEELPFAGHATLGAAWVLRELVRECA